MGIQVVVSRKELINAGCNVDDHYEVHETRGDDGYGDVIDSWTDHTVNVVWPNGVSTWWHGTPHTVWLDFNHWGSNRPRIEPLLKQYFIPFKEV